MENSRREFIKKALYAVLAGFGILFLLSIFRTLAPSRKEEKELSFFPLLPEEAVPRRGVKKTELDYRIGGKERKMRVFIVASPEGLTVFSAVCSHLGCLVNYHKDKREFICPCHGGKYDLNGRNIAGPPPAPLTKLPVKVENGVVLVGMKV
ncbi:MAG: Rieske (2Fe-2S) protein [Nitrospirota bacterium]|nr:Rieske (2Fe-2S) protein [Nitrospirota bacterium]